MGVSYSFLRILEEDGTNLPAGWLLSFSGRVTPLLSAVGEIGGNYKSESGMTVKLHTFQDGLRVSSRANPTVCPYARFLVGGVTLTCCGQGVTKWVVEPGGGVDVPLNDRTALRFGAGIPIVFYRGRHVAGAAAPCGRAVRIRQPVASGWVRASTSCKGGSELKRDDEVEYRQAPDRSAANDVTKPRSLERFDIPEGTLDHSVG